MRVTVRNFPVPSFDVIVATDDDISELAQWLTQASHESMIVNLNGSHFSFRTANERLFFAFGLEAYRDIILGCDRDALSVG